MAIMCSVDVKPYSTNHLSPDIFSTYSLVAIFLCGLAIYIALLVWQHCEQFCLTRVQASFVSSSELIRKRLQTADWTVQLECSDYVLIAWVRVHGRLTEGVFIRTLNVIRVSTLSISSGSTPMTDCTRSLSGWGVTLVQVEQFTTI